MCRMRFVELGEYDVEYMEYVVEYDVGYIECYNG